MGSFTGIRGLDAHHDKARHALESDQGARGKLPGIVTGVQPVSGCVVVLRADIASDVPQS
jgi:hypothetical protein